MNTLKYFMFAILLIICNASASNVKCCEMTVGEVRDVLKSVPGLAVDAWQVSGKEIRSKITSCPERREIILYEKPKIHKDKFVKTKARVLIFTPRKEKQSENCSRLTISKEKNLILAKYGDVENSKNMKDYFKIYGKISDKELVLLGSIIESLQNCLGTKGCSPIKIRNIFSKGDARLKAITIVNIASIEKRPEINGIQSYMITFKTYSENELAIIIYGINSKNPQVDIGAVIP